jgi:hypothetical protein
MTKRIALLLALLLLTAAMPGYAQLVVPGADNTPQVGQPAPDFELPVALGSQQTLGKKDFAGKKKVLLAFYPADFTGG